MKATFVEWDTKIPVWRYEGRPSYTYDTSRIIDATAFGANATATEGCVVGLRHFHTPDRLDELVAFLNTQDVVFLAVRYHWEETYALAERLTPCLLLGFGMAHDQLRDGMQREGGLEAFVALCNRVHLVTIYSEDICPYLRLFTSRPVEYLPMCYPYSYVRDTCRMPIERRQSVVLVPGNVWNTEIGGRRDDICSLLLAHELVRTRPEWRIRLSDRKLHKPDFPYATILPAWLRDRNVGATVTERIDTQPALSWLDFLQWVRGSALSIHCDWIWTTGRMAADMAALGIPHIGGNSDHTRHLFPDLCFEEFDVESMLTRATMILDDPQLAQRLIEIADLWGEQLDYPNWRAWFERLVETYRSAP